MGALLDLVGRIKLETTHPPSGLVAVLSAGDPAQTAVRKLVLPNNRSGAYDTRSGFDAMVEHERLDLTVEHLIVQNPQWHDLVGRDAVRMAEARLELYGKELAEKKKGVQS